MRTPENLELTNPQEFGSSWTAVEVKTPQAGSFCHRWDPASTEGTWPWVREEGHWCEAALPLLLASGPASPALDPVLWLEDMHHPVS